MALLAVALSIGWQLVVVRAAYQGNWTGLFCAGDYFTRPPLIQQHEYTFHSSFGYDGQFYQLIAHDPLLHSHYQTFIDAPRLRYRRILVPALASLFAAGNPARIDAAYIIVCWLFIGLGTFCLAQLAAAGGSSVWWGLLFLATPATLLGIERMTVDFALAACVAAALLTAQRQHWLLLWFALAGAMLAKETGVLAIAAVFVWLVRQKKFPLAAQLTTSLLPSIAWYVFVSSRTAGDYSTSGFQFTAFFSLLTLPIDPGILSLVFRLASITAVVGLLWAAIRSIFLAVRDRFQSLEILLALAFALLVLLFLNRPVWVDPDAFPRVYTPLLISLIAATWKKGFRQTLASFAMVAFPIFLQWGWDFARPLWRGL